ncbi:alpha/beta hydrolase [Nocardia aurantia]|uniref:Diacylglycerol acyltransferase/mycolyltransferase Ag85A n=1 Tax=Nocardia aurantia TaxID=2585199 RepID=A0A7K0DVL8_9NOCA|nr:alpha/beta hydrolase family protein [Nocardia aurantia]MQY29816.1 Diacylglycerol acyltransferase/mycolyltransferase Ag85A [Nocardia aurantia]
MGIHIRGRYGTLLAPLLALALTGAATASADPDLPPIAELTAAARPAVDGSRLTGIAEGPGRMVDIQVYSAAMNSTITVKVLRALDDSKPAPVLYLLNGANGGTDGSSWTQQTDVADFFAGKQATVVIPMGGRGSYFTDWQTDDPVLGRQRWTTFLTRELPAVIDSTFHGSGANAIAGISMAGTSVFQLALAAPGLYRAIGSYSGCAQTSTPAGEVFVAAVVTRWAGNTVNMWGPFGNPAWAANDPYLHADRLRGTAIYVSSGTGLAGPLDTLDGPGIDGNAGKLIAQLTSGGVLDAVTNQCSHAFQSRLADLNIPATFVFRTLGTHSWGYWQQDLHDSWPLFTAAFDR